jgi:hypothetical protein
MAATLRSTRSMAKALLPECVGRRIIGPSGYFTLKGLELGIFPFVEAVHSGANRPLLVRELCDRQAEFRR